ncbi:hypothetical protein IMG5_174880, partial [Ichthyophthirius multifiliis]
MVRIRYIEDIYKQLIENQQNSKNSMYLFLRYQYLYKWNIRITEMSCKIIAFGLQGYVRDRMNIFDGTIVCLSVLEMVLFSGGNKAVSAFRAAIESMDNFDIQEENNNTMLMFKNIDFVDTYLDPESEAQKISSQMDIGFNLFFSIESTLKIIAYGFFMDHNSYLTEAWSQLDFFIVFTSLIDMSFDSVNIPAIKILRLLRTLRPLRFVSHNINMKVVVIALVESVGAIFNVLIVVVLIWFMFAILGISLIGQRLGYCQMDNQQSYYGINYEKVNIYIYIKYIIIYFIQLKCIQMGNNWSVFQTNFDNILYAMNTIFILSSLEGWPDIFFLCVDSDMKEYGPSKDNYSIIFIYFFVFILVGSFFLINLFVGVIFLKFNEAQKNEKRQSLLFLTEQQSRWIEFQIMIIGVKAEFAANNTPVNKYQLFFYKIINFKFFDAFIMLCIVLNIISMAVDYEGSTLEYNQALEQINLVFTSIFMIELVFKLIALGFKGYWISSWNRFDLFIVLSSILDLILNSMGNSMSFLRVGPQLARIMRVMRVSRLLKLVKTMQGLQKLIETLVFSLPSLINVGALLGLVFFIYAVLGVFIFQQVTVGIIINRYNNFSNFSYAMITLFRARTGEDWYKIMLDLSKTTDCTEGKDCGTYFSFIYFISFILIACFIMLNLFILIIIQYFEDYHMKDDNPLQAFNEYLDTFRSVWSKYTAYSNGEKIKMKNLIKFLCELPIPLGYYDKSDDQQLIDKHQVAKDIMNMKLP